MRIIITESQYKLLTEETIKCKCGHSWGWDQEEGEYNIKELKKFLDN